MDSLPERISQLSITESSTLVASAGTEKSALKKIEQSVIGMIKSYCVFKAYGFIQIDESMRQMVSPGSDVLFHQKHVEMDASKFPGLEHGKLRKVIPLKVGQFVEFDLYQKSTGQLVAFEVKGANGSDLVLDEEWIFKQDRGEMARKIAILEKKAADSEAKVKQAEGPASSLCLLCKEEPAIMLYRPCNHLATCEKCFNSKSFQAIHKWASVCIICRRSCIALEKIYFP